MNNQKEQDQEPVQRITQSGNDNNRPPKKEEPNENPKPEWKEPGEPEKDPVYKPEEDPNLDPKMDRMI